MMKIRFNGPKVLAAVSAAAPILLMAGTAFAAAPLPSNLGFLNNISSTISGLGTWVAGLGVTGGTLMVAYHALARNLNDDPQSVAHHTSSIRKVVVGTGLVAGAALVAKFGSGLL